MVAEVTSRRAKRRCHLAELLLYTVMVPARNFQNYSKVGRNNSFIPEFSGVYEWGRGVGEFHVRGSLEYAGFKAWTSCLQGSQPFT